MSTNNGRLGVTMSSAGAWLQVAQIPSTVSVANVSVTAVNQGITDEKLDLAFSMTTSPSNAEKVEHQATIPANGGRYNLACELASPGEYIMVKTLTANVSIRVTAIFQV